MGERCDPFPRSQSHLEEADDSGTPPTVTEVGFERMTFVLKDVCLTHSARAAPNPLAHVRIGKVEYLIFYRVPNLFSCFLDN